MDAQTQELLEQKIYEELMERFVASPTREATKIHDGNKNDIKSEIVKIVTRVILDHVEVGSDVPAVEVAIDETTGMVSVSFEQL